jgi:DNA-binding CsgD family transcriptional regulator
MGTSASPGATRRAEDIPRQITGLPLTMSRFEQVAAVVSRVGELLGWDPPVPLSPPLDVPGATAVLSRAWQDVTEALVDGAGDPDRLTVLVDLLREVRSAEEGVRNDRAARHEATTGLVHEALGGLRDARSVAELAERAPGAGAQIGFDRVLLSRIEDSSWIPETMFVANDARWAEEIVEAGRQDLRTLDNSLLETQIVRRNRPLVVADTDGHTNLHRAMIDAARVRSYAAAPIVGWGRVIGFLHADCHRQGRALDALDRDLLWTFCDGLGHLFVRTAAMDAVEALREELGRMAAGVGRFEAQNRWTVRGAPMAAGQLETSGAPASMEDVEGALTRREVEVMRLMGAGHTNAQIARRLVISEGTVKSHVKHILRKLQAANRAEAVSRWLREEHARRSGGHRNAGRLGA